MKSCSLEVLIHFLPSPWLNNCTSKGLYVYHHYLPVNILGCWGVLHGPLGHIQLRVDAGYLGVMRSFTRGSKICSNPVTINRYQQTQASPNNCVNWKSETLFLKLLLLLLLLDRIFCHNSSFQLNLLFKRLTQPTLYKKALLCSFFLLLFQDQMYFNVKGFNSNSKQIPFYRKLVMPNFFQG